MHPSVSEAWPAVAREFEGVAYHPYLDTVGLVTVGIGSLMDDGTDGPPETFLSLPWVVDGQTATRAQAAAGWLLVKSHQELAPKGGAAFRDVTRLRIPAQVVDALLFARTREFWSILSAELVGLEAWPADAQLALINMGYQLGPNFLGSAWPKFTAAAAAEDFAACAAQCSIKNAPLRRNLRNLLWFRNAAVVTANGIDPAALWDAIVPVKEVEVLSDEDIARIASAVAVELKVPSKEAIALEVLTRDGLIRNVSPTSAGGDYVTLATAVERLAKDVKRLT